MQYLIDISEKNILTVEIDTIEAKTYVKISDNGPGIDPQHVDRIFEHGFSTKDGHPGIGLHFCANAIAEMGAEIKIEGAGSGHGTVVTIYFALNLPETT